MSQAGSIGGSGGGGGPTVPTSFNTDNGNAVPAANILLVKGADSTDLQNLGIATPFNIHTIQANGGVAGTGTANQVDLVLANQYHGSGSFSDGAIHTLVTIPVTITNGSLRFQFVAAVYDITANLSSTLRFDASFRVSGGVNTALPDFTIDIHEDPAFNYGLVNLNGSVPGQITINVTGKNGNTIQWVVVGTYTQVGT